MPKGKQNKNPATRFRRKKARDKKDEDWKQKFSNRGPKKATRQFKAGKSYTSGEGRFYVADKHGSLRRVPPPAK